MRLQKTKAPQITDSIINEIVTKIVENFSPKKIRLFGSQVWGKPQEWSDIDLLVIMNINDPSSRASAKISIFAKSRFIPMDILLRTPNEIEERIKMGDYIIRRILSEVRILYER